MSPEKSWRAVAMKSRSAGGATGTGVGFSALIRTRESGASDPDSGCRAGASGPALTGLTSCRRHVCQTSNVPEWTSHSATSSHSPGDYVRERSTAFGYLTRVGVRSITCWRASIRLSELVACYEAQPDGTVQNCEAGELADILNL